MTYTKRMAKVFASLLAALMLALAVLCVAPLEVRAAEDPVNYIYFDLAAGSITINATTYTGYVHVNGTKATVTGAHSSENHYYVYQSTAANRSTTGYLNGKVEGIPELPTYDRVTYNGESWGDFITNHPGDTNASTNDDDAYDGSASVKQVIMAWEDAVSEKRTSTGNKITFSGNVGEVELVIDNIWSHYQDSNNRRNQRTDGAIEYYTNYSNVNNNRVTIKLKGDNRLPNIYYNTYGPNDTGHFVPVNNSLVFDAMESDATLTVADNKDAYNGNYWCSAIGSSDHNGDKCYGIIFNGGIIYAGTTDADDCTAIGGGGNGAATIIINGGTITAVASTSGATIGGGIGKSAKGGSADISITGGAVYSYNFGYGYGSQLINRTSDSYIVSSAIGGGSSYASAGCEYAYVKISGGTVYAQSVGGTAIGGGSSIIQNGGSTEVTISGGTITAKSVSGKLYDNSKDKYVDIPAGVAIGGGTGNETGGTATLSVSGDAKLYTGSIGGGGFTATNGKGKIGPAFITISGGTIQGQVVMQGSMTIDGAERYSTFEMTGGVIDNQNAAGYVFKETNGGAVCVKSGTATISGGTMQNCNAQNGGAVYVSGGDVSMTDGTITVCQATDNGGAVCVEGGAFAISGGTITNNRAQHGGAVYVSGGNATMSGGTITDNSAQNGGAAYLAGTGTMTVTGGTLSNNQATVNGGAAYLGGGKLTIDGGALSENKAIEGSGGAAYVRGGDVIMTGGTMSQCTAAENGGAVCVEDGSFTIKGSGSVDNSSAALGGAVYVSGGDANVNGGTLTGCSANQGGAIYVVGGTVTMLGGQITDNDATNGNGGAIYVTGSTGLQVTVQSGEISGNTATGNGGAICVDGQGTSEPITVQIGVNELHYDPYGTDAVPPCDHNGNNLDDDTCPVVEDNTCALEGGAIYITGTDQTYLNIYCITEAGNRGEGNAADSEETSMSDFLKVNGGQVLISAETSDPNAPEDEKIYFGNSVINSSIHVTGGDLTVKGTLTNPAILAPITVDVEKAGGSYHDERKNDTARPGQTQYYVVKYFENYKENESDAQATGQYTVHQTPKNESHTVWGVIYFHSGKTIVGWNTDPGGEEAGGKTFGVSTVINHGKDFTDAHLDDGITLELYAIWKDNFYWIQFDPNTESYTGTMGDAEHKKSYLCAAEGETLLPNQYVNRSYKFVGWATSPSGEKVYDDKQVLQTALTQEVGKVITLYAVWEICDHVDTERFVFAKVDESSITCTCQCAYVVTATIVPPTGSLKYNGDSHPATVVYTNDNGGSFTENKITQTNQAGDSFNNLTISYDYEPIINEPGLVGDTINAGKYTAKVRFDGKTISVTFDITQATQPAPEKPTFTASGNTLTIDLPKKTTGPAETTIQYKLVHHDSTSNQLVEVGPQEDRVFQRFDASWALYYIAAFYPGNNNYLESHEATSDQKYLFQGEIGITITYTEGMTTELVKNGEEASLVSEAWPDYYISSGYNATVKGSLASNGETLTGTALEKHFKRIENAFAYSISSFQKSYSGNITITFTGAKKKPTVDTYVAPDENFGAISNTPTTVSRDSAFTAYFEVNYYDSTAYENLTLSFGQALPVGATVILVDKTTDSYSYWYAQGGSDTIALASFKKMGGGVGAPAETDASLKYQFIVDFSDEKITLDSLTFKLTASKKDTYAPDLQEDPGSVSFTSVSHRMETTAVDGASATVEFGYAQGSAPASKWADREVAIVLTPAANLEKPLPIDVSVKVVQTVGSTTKSTTVTRDDGGRFVVPIDPAATKLEIILQSQMFETAEYKFQVEAYAAYKGCAPTNGISLSAPSNLVLTTAPRAQNAAKITIKGDKRIYSLTETISGTIEIRLAEGYTATATLLKKHGADGYVSTGFSQVLNNGPNPLTISNLGSFNEGDFCLSVVIRDASNTAVLTVPYYLIIQK